MRGALIEIFALDQLLSSSKLTKKGVAELDRIIEAKAWKKLRDYADSVVDTNRIIVVLLRDGTVRRTVTTDK